MGGSQVWRWCGVDDVALGECWLGPSEAGELGDDPILFLVQSLHLG